MDLHKTWWKDLVGHETKKKHFGTNLDKGADLRFFTRAFLLILLFSVNKHRF